MSTLNSSCGSSLNLPAGPWSEHHGLGSLESEFNISNLLREDTPCKEDDSLALAQGSRPSLLHGNPCIPTPAYRDESRSSWLWLHYECSKGKVLLTQSPLQVDYEYGPDTGLIREPLKQDTGASWLHIGPYYQVNKWHETSNIRTFYLMWWTTNLIPKVAKHSNGIYLCLQFIFIP